MRSSNGKSGFDGKCGSDCKNDSQERFACDVSSGSNVEVIVMVEEYCHIIPYQK